MDRLWAWVERCKQVLRNERVVGTTDDVGRIFMRCHDCKRVVPAWRLLRKTLMGQVGCTCGSPYVVPREIPNWQAAWWYFVRGILVRKWLMRRDDFDPRVPWRAA